MPKNRRSVATIDNPEFINIKPYNPLISECEIKVMYVGENRNRSFISKEVAAEMANTLPGCPIVGYYKEDKKDFMDHGEQMIIDGEGIKFNCLTRPYGFVAPNAKVWFQKFEDTDEFGNTQVREYLMTTGYLWTGQYEEAKSVFESEGGKPHSMEIDNDTLDGYWAKNPKTQIEFFIINDGIFSKLCILGDDVEPCFEGSTITAPDISTSFTKIDDNFKHTLFSMMQELKTALEGGQHMAFSDVNEKFSSEEDKVNKTEFEENHEEIEDNASSSFAQKDEKEEDDEASKKDEQADDKKADDESEEDKNKKFAKEDDEDDKKDEASEDDKKDEDDDKKDENDDKDEDEKNKEDKYSLLENKYNLLSSDYNTLLSQFTALQSECEELKTFKLTIENEKKDALINSFYMLSDEDKADVIANKLQYSLEDIESKLSVICVRKKVSFAMEEEQKSNDVITTFNLGDVDSNVPSWIKAVRRTAKE